MLGKRILDLCLTIPAVIVLAPVFLLIAIWVKIDSKGPVLFCQTRVGRFERLFSIYKFRTMIPNAEQAGMKITVGEDPRITRAGKLLRKFKLDELPQLFNVLKGEMSLVGPRPEVPYYVEKYSLESRAVIFSVPPGITDMASIAFRSENELLSKSEDPERIYIEQIMLLKIRYCEDYVKNRSLWLDIKIMVMTFLVIFHLWPGSSSKDAINRGPIL